MEAIKQLFWSSRPVSWINTAYPFAIAYWLASGDAGATLWLGALFFLIPYNLLMYGINDVFDYESDLRNPRKGGIEGALLDPKWHRLTVTAAVISCIPFVAYLTFVGPMIFGLALAGADISEFKLLSMILAFTLWGIASHAFGAVQDVQADREGGISSIATVIGARSTVRFAFVAYLAAGLLVLNAGWPGALAAIAAVPYLFIVGPFWNITDATCEQANRGWKKFIWLNFFAGFVVSLLVIWFAIIR